MILLIGDPRDPHVLEVAGALARLRRSVAIFSRFSRLCTISLAYAGSRWTLEFAVDRTRFDGAEIEAVWWRQKPFSYYAQSPETQPEAAIFADREWYQLLQSLPDFLPLPASGWINHPTLQLQANLKPVQLQWAQAAGLSIAETTFTNMADAVGTMTEPSRLTVYKTFSGHVFDGGGFIFTSPLKAALGPGARDQIAMAPGIYQAYLEKRYELRIYFIDQTLYSIRVDSQKARKTRIDWRRDQAVDIYEIVELEDDLRRRLLEFARLSRLRFGAIDGIVAPDGEFFFLECNPAGQWLWIEQFTGAPIAQTLAEALANGGLDDRRAGSHGTAAAGAEPARVEATLGRSPGR